MKVRFDQSGGYAGLLKRHEIDTSKLTPEEAREVERLVQLSDLPASGEFLSASSRDLHQYDITIVDGASKRSVTYDAESLPPSAKPLVSYLKKAAKPAGK